MKYLCLIYDDESTLAAMPKEEADAFMGGYFAFTEQTKAAGQYVAGEALHPVHTATTVRIRGGTLTTTDGPFAETREQLGGFYLVEARDLNEAIAIAARIPSAHTGSIEVRPVVDFGRPDANAAAMRATTPHPQPA
jgi:hypothetical protein